MRERLGLLREQGRVWSGDRTWRRLAPTAALLSLATAYLRNQQRTRRRGAEMVAMEPATQRCGCSWRLLRNQNKWEEGGVLRREDHGGFRRVE